MLLVLVLLFQSLLFPIFKARPQVRFSKDGKLLAVIAVGYTIKILACTGSDVGAALSEALGKVGNLLSSVHLPRNSCCLFQQGYSLSWPYFVSEQLLRNGNVFNSNIESDGAAEDSNERVQSRCNDFLQKCQNAYVCC